MNHATSWSLSRLLRLVQKEVRESLRDRRTLATLILMPLIVYPILSLALQRLVVTSGLSGKPSTKIRIAVATPEDAEQLVEMIQASYAYRWERQQAIQAIEDGEDTKEPESPFDLQLAITDPTVFLENGSIDLVVRSTSVPDDPSQRQAWRATDLQIDYRKGDPISEQGLQLLEDVLHDVNELEIKKRFPKWRPDVQWNAVARKSSRDLSVGLATVIPLVLLLMTITGAVYPAIDLTAGERERGTMEALIATPTPKFQILLSKYGAVVLVAILTAIANLVAMWMTLSVSGIGRALLGNEGFSLVKAFRILPLLALFAAFFSAILLSLCSFARSFKEAQAYLIPVMLMALAPGMVTLLPGVHLTPGTAWVPLVNMVLLAREIMIGSVDPASSLIAVASTLLYAALTLFLASHLFGREATRPGGSEGSWQAFGNTLRPTPGQLTGLLAVLYPLFFLLSNLAAGMASWAPWERLAANGLILLLLFFLIPTLYCRLRHVGIPSTFPLRHFGWRTLSMLAGCFLIASSLWMLAFEFYLLSERWEWIRISEDQRQLVELERQKLLQLPWWQLMLWTAVVPAFAEEWFFRGFLLSSVWRWKPWQKIALSGLLFGLFHVFVGQIVALERWLPTTILGLAFAWLTIATGSILPGMLVHGLHNAALFSLTYYKELVEGLGWFPTMTDHLPSSWWIAGALAIMAGTALVVWSSKVGRREFEDGQ
ncbi:MAG: ABC transporter permease subunit/CPBP intramembrane protease [Pirellulaceae bacterium]